ncbi:MAG: hypothetical protein R3E76_16110 [Planctomycetota bacterium]
MDQQTFRRLAPDAVAGRLDATTLERWKAAAAADPERASFVVRVVEADSKVSGQFEPVRDVKATEPSRKVPRRTVLGLAVFFAVFGAMAGGLAMNSYLRSQARMNSPSTGLVEDNTAPRNAPDSGPADNTTGPGPAANTPRTNEPSNVEPTPEPDLPFEPEPDPPPVTRNTPRSGVTVATGRVRGRKAGSDWFDLKVGDSLDGIERVAVLDGRFAYSRAGLSIQGEGRFEFGWDGATVCCLDGRMVVKADGVDFTAYKTDWRVIDAKFVIEAKRFGGDLYLLSGTLQIDAGNDTIPMQSGHHLSLETNKTRPLSADETRALDLELLGPHRVLLHWNMESSETTPNLGELFSPGALGDGHAVRRKTGEPGIGVNPGEPCFVAEEGARFRMWVKTSAERIRIEFRVELDDGFRAVDALIDVPEQDRWVMVEAPLKELGAGRFRSEVGWLPGRAYSAFLVAPAIDIDSPLARHDLSIDDVMIYVAE